MTDRLDIVEGDITQLDVDAIVNAANTSLLGGGGVDGAIHRAAGRELLEACQKLGRCRAGQARLTLGYRLKARHIIHAVGPFWQGGKQSEDAVLASAYRSSLEIAFREGFDTIAFPAISTGVYLFPLDRATKIAVGTVVEFLREHEFPKKVIFCCFTPEATALYRQALAEDE